MLNDGDVNKSKQYKDSIVMQNFSLQIFDFTGEKASISS